MKSALVAVSLSLICLPAWAQPSPAEREQERQAKQYRERHPGSTPAAAQRPASVRTSDKKAKPPRPKRGEAALSPQNSPQR